ncbi:MAG: PH domain-containing protein [Candidatus Moraniibacteriota bacterium]
MPTQINDLTKLATDTSLKRSRDFLKHKREVGEINLYVQKIIKEGGERERLIIFLRRHWINLFVQLLPFLIIVLILFVSYILLYYFTSIKIIDPLEWQFIRLAVALFSLFLWSFVFVVFIDYYLDVWIVTDCRIVNIEQKGLFRREISELRLDNVQDLTTEITGMISTFFDFGDLYVQTAGKRERFQFKSIPHPERVRDVVLILSEDEGK